MKEIFYNLRGIIGTTLIYWGIGVLHNDDPIKNSLMKAIVQILKQSK